MVNKYRDKLVSGDDYRIVEDEDETYSDLPIEITRDPKKFKIIHEAGLDEANVIPAFVPAF